MTQTQQPKIGRFSCAASDGADIGARNKGNNLTALEMALRKDSTKVAEVIVGTTSRAVLVDPEFKKAIDAWREGRLREAYDTFNLLVLEYPESEYLNRALARTAYSLGRHPHAMAAIERILLQRPGDINARVFLARCYFMQHRYELARKELEDILESTEERRVVELVKGYLNVIDRMTKQKGWHLRVAVGGLHDSNVNVGPDSDVISIAPFEFEGMTFESLEVGEESRPIEADGAFIFSSLSLLHEIGRAGKWQLIASGAYYQTLLGGNSEYEMLYLGGSGGLRYVRRNHVVELPIRLSHISRGGDGLVNIYGFSPAWIVVLGQENRWNLFASSSLEYRDFADLDYRDGPFVSAGAGCRRFVGRKGHFISAGVSFQREEADAEAYRNNTVEAVVGATVRLPWSSAITAGARYRISQYDDKSSDLETEKREDTQQQLSVGLTKAMSSRWVIDVNAQITENRSTFGLYEYDRWQATLSTSYGF